MLAVKNVNIYIVRYLASKGANKCLADKKGNNVFHYAANTSKDVIQVGQDPMSHLYTGGHTGIQVGIYRYTGVYRYTGGYTGCIQVGILHTGGPRPYVTFESIYQPKLVDP